VRFRAASVTSVAIAAFACSSEPDVVVAEQPQPASTTPVLDVELNGCLPGIYRGIFFGETRIGGSASPVEGNIRFSLVQSQRGEFLVITNSELEGSTLSGLEFQATFVGAGDHSCRDRQIMGALQGTFNFGGGVEFGGNVDGEYDPDDQSFHGQWETRFAALPDLRSEGEWHAYHIGPAP
jgi:hypothetical protein